MRVLCIDDDRRLFELLASYFAPNGVTLVHATDGAKGLAALERDVFDAVLLDVMMPGMDGLEVCRRIRQTRQIPVIMLTARGDEADRVVGLELGADDYVPKPFSPRELLARLRAVMRRAQPAATGAEIVVGRVAIDIAARQVRVGAELADLTGLEFDILVALARRPGRVVPRETLLGEAGGAGGGGGGGRGGGGGGRGGGRGPPRPAPAPPPRGGRRPAPPPRPPRLI